MSGRFEFDFTFKNSRSNTNASRKHSGAMRILVMGDFSGRKNRGLRENSDALRERPILTIDVDNFDDVIKRLSPQINLSLGDAPATKFLIQFKNIDDFHPDEIYQKLELFQALKELRTQLAEPTTFSQAASKLRYETNSIEIPTSEPLLEETDSAMFERLLGKEPAEKGEQQAIVQTPIKQLIRDIVTPYVVQEADSMQSQYLAGTDEAISEQMRNILHHPDFQQMEAAWRSLHDLVTSVETSEELKLYLVDISKNELLADITTSQNSLEESGLYQLLVEQGMRTLGGEPWSVLVGNYSFGTNTDDIGLLGALGAIASQAGGPFLAAAKPDILGCNSLVETPEPKHWNLSDKDKLRWQSLRESPYAQWIGLAIPRILLRLPYGKETDSLEQFEFEELGTGRIHKNYLWGNPAFGCLKLITAAYQLRGWEMEPGDILDIEDLPAHTFEEDGETKMQACAEGYLSERTAEAISNRGLISLVSYRNRNTVRVVRLQSVAVPQKALSGIWS